MGDFDTTGHCPKCNKRWFLFEVEGEIARTTCRHCGYVKTEPRRVNLK